MKLLCDVIKISNGFINSNVLKSNEIVTKCTIPAKQKTELLSGIPINTNISEMELQLCTGFSREMKRDFFRTVHQINVKAIALLAGLITFKEKLLLLAKQQDCRAEAALTQKSLNEVLKIRDFKASGTEGILNCNISSIILPLLADHVLREANHYIRILECSGNM